MSGQTNGGVFNPRNLNMFGYTYNNPVNLVDPDGESVEDVVSIGADFTPIVGNVKAAQEAYTGTNLLTGEKLSTADRVIAVGGVIAGGLAKKTVQGLKWAGSEVFAWAKGLLKSRKYTVDNPLTGNVWGIQKSITEKVRSSLSRSQNRAMSKLDEMIHNFEKRSTLSGDNLDDGHIEKLQGYANGLNREVNSLQKSLNNRNLSDEVKGAIESKIDIAQKMQNRIMVLTGDK